MGNQFVRVSAAVLAGVLVVLLFTPYASEYSDGWGRRASSYTVRIAGFFYYPFQPVDHTNVQLDFQTGRQNGESWRARIAWEIAAIEWFFFSLLALAWLPDSNQRKPTTGDA